jgi:CRP/FNR family cyclic AMP-dependent transcriptional regulator
MRRRPEKKMNEDRLNAALLESMIALGMTRSFRKNVILINEDDSSNALYIILAGKVQAYASSPDGRQVVLSEYGPGEYFGELALDGGRRTASVRTLDATTCCVIQALDLRDVLAMHPDFALHLIQKLSRMVRRSTDQVKQLALNDVYGRLVRLFMELSDENGLDGRRLMREPLTQQDIADRIGSSREMVNRVLKELMTGGYVSVERGLYAIHRRLPRGR